MRKSRQLKASFHPPIREVVERLRTLAALGPDWDSYGGDPPSRMALEVAENLVSEVGAWFGDLPGFADTLDIMPSPDGGVLLIWSDGKHTTQVRVLADGHLDTLLIDEADSGPRYQEHHDVPRPQALRAMARVFGDR